MATLRILCLKVFVFARKIFGKKTKSSKRLTKRRQPYINISFQRQYSFFHREKEISIDFFAEKICKVKYLENYKSSKSPSTDLLNEMNVLTFIYSLIMQKVSKSRKQSCEFLISI